MLVAFYVELLDANEIEMHALEVKEVELEVQVELEEFEDEN